jgi:hypothetical protein
MPDVSTAIKKGGVKDLLVPLVSLLPQVPIGRTAIKHKYKSNCKIGTD